MAKFELTDFMVRGEDGKLDLLTSCQNFEDAIVLYDVEVCQKMEQIDTAMHAAFDKYPGARFNVPALKSEIQASLGTSPANFSEVAEKISEYLKVAAANGVIKVEKGPKGGVTRLRKPGDPVPAAETAAPAAESTSETPAA